MSSLEQSMNKYPNLEEWEVVPVNVSGTAYTAPELQSKIWLLQGEIFNHSSHKDGNCIRTSQVRSVSEEVGLAVVMTASGSKYILGKPNDMFVEFVETLPTYKPPEIDLITDEMGPNKKIAMARAGLGLVE